MDKKILMVEDEMNIIELVKYNFELEDFDFNYEKNGKVALDKIRNNDYDLILLDLMLPGLDGITICKIIRKENIDVPVIMLTAKSEENDKIVGLDIGADDYVTKPFSVNELIARVKSVLRRYSKSSNIKKDIYKLKDLEININKYQVKRGKEVFNLTHKEFELLKLLVQNKGNVLSRNKLLDQIWGYDYFGETRTVDVHIRHLRKKLGKKSDKKYILTVRGVGYKVE
ncbi:MAG: winged helix-turn-helix domain-containing protein [Bacillota bacterium]